MFCTVLVYRLTETQQRNYVLPGGGNTPVLLLGSNCGVTSCSESRPDSLYSNQKALFIYFCWAFTTRGRCAGKSKQINTVYAFIKSNFNYSEYLTIDSFFLKFAAVPIYPICTNPAVSTDPESATASLMWSAQLVALHWLNASVVCPQEWNCPLKFCPRP